MKKSLIIIAFLIFYLVGQNVENANYERTARQMYREKISAYREYDMSITKSAEERILDTSERKQKVSDHLSLK